MKYIPRLIEHSIQKALQRNKSVLLLGARQTGKTTLINNLKGDLYISFIRPEIRQRYEKHPSLLGGEIEALGSKGKGSRPLVLLDEVQKVPAILDIVQDLIDRKIANFILTGSSARKLRHSRTINLLPGRIISLKLDPLTLRETPNDTLKNHILYGSLPGIIQVARNQNRETDLESYVTAYLEEEIRAEAIVKNLGSFARFLEYAASESGMIVNFRKLSNEIGVSHTTIASYYEILEDCMIAERIEPISTSKTRKKLTKTQKYLFFDLGVRRLSAHEGAEPPRETLGKLFEQFIGLEILRCARLCRKKTKLRFWRDPDGPEVDWVIENENTLTPVEVKWTPTPSQKDIKHLNVFLSEYKNAKMAYLVCQTSRKVKLGDRIFALPWQLVDDLVFKENL